MLVNLNFKKGHIIMNINNTKKYTVLNIKEIGQPEWRFTKYLKNQTGNIKDIEKVCRIA